jgi:RNA-directed DNA polymerase
VDGKTVEAFGNHIDEEIARLRAAWQSGMYRPQAVRQAWIPKPGRDEQRPLGIPTVRDRVVQTALKLVLEPIFESTFSEHSYGFRPGRSAHGALQAVVGHLEAGKVWVVDVDLTKYFDSIRHERLLALVRRKVTDRRVLDLIGAFLKAGVLKEGEWTAPEAGTPQGGVISPLLANIYLNDLDHSMAQVGMAMERYADDLVICCRTQEEAERALAHVQEWTAQAGLSLHPAKTRVVDLGRPGEYVDFLGYRLQRHIDRQGRDRILRLVRPQSLDRIKDTIRRRTPRKSGVSLAEQIGWLNPVLRGWFGYFRSVTQPTHAALDKMVRRRLRSMLCKRIGWHMSWGGGEAQKRWPKTFFTEQGLFSLEEAHRQFVHAPRRAHRLESRMRENRLYGSEGGVAG